MKERFQHKFCERFYGSCGNRLYNTENLLRKNRIEWNRKFSLSFACIVLFMIGAPLGSIIRKGGLGSPLVFAVIFFVIFHLLNTFGEKFAKKVLQVLLQVCGFQHLY